MSEQPAHPLNGFLLGARLSRKLNLAIGEANRLSDLCWPVNADRVGVKSRFCCCDGQHRAGSCPWRAAFDEGDDPALRVAEVGILGCGCGALCLRGGHGHAEENRCNGNAVRHLFVAVTKGIQKSRDLAVIAACWILGM